MRETRGRFEIERTERTLVLRDPGARGATRLTLFAPLVAFALFPLGLLAAGTETTSLWPWGIFVGLGIATWTSDLVYSLRHRAHEVPPYRYIREALSIEAMPATGGPRDALPRPVLRIDGCPIDFGEAPRVALTRTGAQHHVSLVMGSEVVRVDTLPDRASAAALAEELCVTLGLALPPAEAAVEELRDLGLPIGFASLFALGGVVGAACWGIFTDLPDRVGAPVLVATVFTFTALAVARRLSLRTVQAEAGWAARRAHGTPRPEPTRSRGGCLFTAAVLAVLVAAAIGAAQIAALELPGSTGYCWCSETPRICGVDVNGDNVPEAIGCTCNGTGPWATFVFSAIDARSGARTEPPTRVDSSSLVSCESPSLVIDVSGEDKSSDVSAYRNFLERHDSLWRVTVPGKVIEIVRSQGCALVHSGDAGLAEGWHTFSLATGGPCAAIPEPVSPAAIDAARREQELPQPPPGQRTVDAITYTLAAPESSYGLTLTASRGEALLWSTDLPARPLEGLPLAVAEGTVVVAASDLRRGKYLRIVGVDAATGSVRYVRRHPGKPNQRIDLAAAGPMVLIQSGRLAGVEPASGRVVWITKE